MNDITHDPSFSYETSPDLYLFTSLTAGSSHIITATSRLETILKANRIPFKAVDCATDEKARRIWTRRASGKRLPGLVKEGTVLGDLEVVEEWNEFGEIKQMLGGGAPAKPPAAAVASVPAPTAPAMPTATAAKDIHAEEKTDDKVTNSDLPSTTIQKDLPHRTAETKPTMQQLHAQLGAEAAAIAQLHSKKALRPILDHEGKRQNSANSETDATAGSEEVKTAPNDQATEASSAAPASVSEEPVAVKDDIETTDKPSENADEAPATAATEAATPTESSATTEQTTIAALAPSSLTFAEPPTRDGEAAADSTSKTDEVPATSTTEALATEPAKATEAPSTATPLHSSLTFIEPPGRPHDTDTADAEADATAKSTTSTPSPPGLEPIPISSALASATPIGNASPPDPGREPRASNTAGDLATSPPPPHHRAHHGSIGSIGSIDSVSEMENIGPSASATAGAAAPSLDGATAGGQDAAVTAPKAGEISTLHRGSSVSVASAEEIKEVEGRNAIAEVDEEAIEAEEAEKDDKEGVVAEQGEEKATATGDLETVEEDTAEEPAIEEKA